uniref:Uncharacterized protein n=1 Tax=Glossina pallidipes TaxID=7398 RepID=A0A1A9ZRC0_GLOPL
MLKIKPAKRCKYDVRDAALRSLSRDLCRWIVFSFILIADICCYVSAEPYGGGSVGIHIPGGSIGAISESRCPRTYLIAFLWKSSSLKLLLPKL